MRNLARLTRSAALLVVLALAGCEDLLDVNNPNDLVEESIRQQPAANAVVNGALSLVADAASAIWQPYLVASDEMTWIGSRDAFLQLHKGFVANSENEFIDEFFDEPAQARWMADEAIEILEGHVADAPNNTDFKLDLARAYLYSGVIYTIIGEVFEDFAFSDKTEAGPPVGPDNMDSVLQTGISRLDEAVTRFGSLGETDWETIALPARTRAHHSLAIWNKINPTASGADPLVNSAAANSDARAVLDRVGPNWSWGFTYSASTLDNQMAAWVNDRKENTFDPSLVTLSDANDVTGVALLDPVDGIPDPVVAAKLMKWKGGTVTAAGDPYSPMDYLTADLMHVILAEAALAQGDMTAFADHINALRDDAGLSDWTGQVDAMDILRHERRVHVMLMGLRLADMYRFGVVDPAWENASAAVQSPGEMLAIAITEIRANCHLNGTGCGG